LDGPIILASRGTSATDILEKKPSFKGEIDTCQSKIPPMFPNKVAILLNQVDPQSVLK
jgi:hypothetical protein